MAYNDTRIAYELQRAAAHIVAPVMKLTGLRFSKASRGTWVCVLIDRVAANLLADGIKPDRMIF